MSRVQRKILKIDADAAGVDAYEWHMRSAADDVAGWLAEIDAGNVPPDDTTDLPEWPIPEVEGDFDFAVVQMDDAGNRSDPASFSTWQAVSLDLSPPPPATGGVIENFAG